MSFYDDTDGLAGGENYRAGKPVDKTGLVIQFYHVPTVKIDNLTNFSKATFKAFLTDFNDKFKTAWNPKETFGRMDAVQTFKNTQRTISFSFDVPSFSDADAIQNFHELEKLIMMQYPVYETQTVVGTPVTQTESTKTQDDKTRENAIAAITSQAGSYKQNTRFMSSPPLIYLKFKNWIANNNIESTNDFSDCLVVAIDGVDFKPDLEQGVFENNGLLIPKLFSVSLNMTVIHTTELGWTQISVDNSPTSYFGESSQKTNNENDFVSFPYRIVRNGS